MSILIQPEPLYTSIYIAIGVFSGFGLLYALCKYLYRKYYHILSVRYANRNIINSDFGTISTSTSSTANLLNGTDASRSKVKSGRMKSVDAFRGLCLAIMIFANYGAGGYSILVSIYY
jgi:heparan-alpha-glucosaminide N-acetyltransferase